MHEHIFSVLPLDKAIALGCVEPLHCAFFFHLLMFPSLLLQNLHLRSVVAPRNKKRGLRRDSRKPPQSCTKRKTRVKCPTIIQQEIPAHPALRSLVRRRWSLRRRRLVTTFEFYRFRFYFRALDRVHFPPGRSANVVRGAFGAVLHDTVPSEVYRRLFEPGASLGAGPSGLADWPRPFVLRVAHLDGLVVAPG